ncbi:MAG: 50S ribosomal protein L23 [Candidatus Altiarchaeum hamiconexum]|uniref:Large ribosomal subunit protein uL23 n=1 Tax=Candidatus Altarchaeum hamiconexum TaxID=1803513 RepID=A0A8J8CFE1_9ARCH|nr:50S ribosomal protein L23 [Candidatus Altarchaeum hamiconexum]OIQ04637.1 MAG: 50S ribosomal protein L23 [Candidatus Altarchaeum sp. CG2_30_32_3053]PIN67173.1 MAG: 50S ribosomal protein L23 [Candidatus Altarchaeum sp. CG12_big_fil_rev_8_21_14_0_65_33_22]PIV28224.1 MAG: 50S ribosomal protein L23 [Candidatus Altarchaeum sp. CG03_land_8_20_14_0_80_32_618]PIX48660.1 MAG: 50S ribosomal protein L23 [Candidatus Altarchaeum sp. CG_4_8_14_3_um_filter_33_2054]PIZ30823.1 MAG: 50S ribosomal protein L23 
MGIILYPLMGEKAVNLREKNNTLSFAVDIKATKEQIKEELEKDYRIKVIKVNTIIIHGMKKAYTKLMPEYSAVDIASRFGAI